MDDIIAERKRKAEKIIELYSEKPYRQEDTANELKISISIVRKVTQAYGFEHGKRKALQIQII